MSKGLILKRLPLATTLHKNARKYTQKIPKNRNLLLIIRILRLKMRKNNIKITFGGCFQHTFSVSAPWLAWTQQKM